MPAIEIAQLSKRYRTVTALAGCDLAVNEGSVVGLLGENGAGKTTLMRVLLGLVKADSGSVSVLGGRQPGNALGLRPDRRDHRGARVLPVAQRAPEHISALRRKRNEADL